MKLQSINLKKLITVFFLTCNLMHLFLNEKETFKEILILFSYVNYRNKEFATFIFIVLISFFNQYILPTFTFLLQYRKLLIYSKGFSQLKNTAMKSLYLWCWRNNLEWTICKNSFSINDKSKNNLMQIEVEMK